MSGAEYAQYQYYQQQAQAPPPAAVPSVSVVYGDKRPTFGEDGTGTPYSSMLNLTSHHQQQEVSYDTSSKDPHMIRARVFIGNIARAILTRDDIIDLFRPFGKVTAVNYFAQAGFGFVQFTEAAHADQSCLKLNNTPWKGCILDVHLAMLGSLKKPEKERQPTAPIPAALAAPNSAAAAFSAQGDSKNQSSKRPYEDEEYEIFKQNKKNKTYASSDRTENEQMAPNEMCDTMICGNCRFVSSDFEEFKDHRIAGCNKFKDPEEPRHRLKCATCQQRFLGAWALLTHLTEFHRMLLYNEEAIPTAAAPAPAENPIGAHELSAEPVLIESSSASNNGSSNQGTPVTNLE